MTFESILFNKTGEGANEVSSEAPAFFVDLNLNQIIDAITADRDIYNLQPFFTLPCIVRMPSNTAMKTCRNSKMKI